MFSKRKESKAISVSGIEYLIFRELNPSGTNYSYKVYKNINGNFTRAGAAKTIFKRDIFSAIGIQPPHNATTVTMGNIIWENI
jgi:hypothetical protein